MRVFVLCSGRCGSSTFTKAASHIGNFTSAHESRWNVPNLQQRLAYPDQHIEADNRLSWLTGPLWERYGQDENVRWVHLTRDTAATAASFVNWNPDGGLLGTGWIRGLMCMRGPAKLTAPQRLELATSLVETITANLTLFMAGVGDRGMRFRLETAEQDWATFWRWIGAEGDFAAALAEWRVRHNASQQRKS